MNEFDTVNQPAMAAAALLKALAHPERLVVMCQLIEGEKGVNELMAHSQLGQSAFSQQLAVLRQHQLVRTRKVAKQIYYSLANAVIIELLQVLQQHYCAARLASNGRDEALTSRSEPRQPERDSAMLASGRVSVEPLGAVWPHQDPEALAEKGAGHGRHHRRKS